MKSRIAFFSLVLLLALGGGTAAWGISQVFHDRGYTFPALHRRDESPETAGWARGAGFSPAYPGGDESLAQPVSGKEERGYFLYPGRLGGGELRPMGRISGPS